MPREKEAYQDNLELLMEAFPDKKLLCVMDVAKWAGRDRRMIKRLYFKDRPFLSVAEVARRIS